MDNWSLRTVSAVSVVQRTASGARVVRVLANDGQMYWVKFPTGGHGVYGPTFEVIVTILGRLIGVAVPDAALVHVPPELPQAFDSAGVSFAGTTGFGSLNVPNTNVSDSIRHVESAENSRRFARLLALSELCLADDEQFLYDRGSHRVTPFDFDSWLGATHPGWTAQWIRDDASTSYVRQMGGLWTGVSDRLDRDELLGARASIHALAHSDFEAAVDAVPDLWGQTVEGLESVASLLYERRDLVIDTLDHAVSAARSRR